MPTPNSNNTTLPTDSPFTPYVSYAVPKPPSTPKDTNPNPPSNTTIPVDTITNPVTETAPQLPTNQPSNVDKTLEGIMAQAQAISDELAEKKASQDQAAVAGTQDVNNITPQNAAQQVLDLTNQDLSDDKQAIREEEQLEEKGKHARQLYNRILQRDQSYKKQIEELEKNKEGKLSGALQGQINNLNRERSRELADLSIAYNIANGDFLAAKESVTNRIADMEADIDRQIKGWEIAFNFAQNDMTESEKLEAQQSFDKEMAEINFGYQKELADYNAALAKEQARYENSLKQTDPVAFGELAQAKAQSDIETIDSLLTSPAMDSSVGTSIFSRGAASLKGVVGRFLGGFGLGFAGGAAAAAPTVVGSVPAGVATGLVTGTAAALQGSKDTITGDRQTFIGSVSQLSKRLTLTSLIQAKEDGATFGALAIPEMELLAESATKINSWEIKDKEGNILGYNASEKAFKAELDKINNFAKLDYILRGGDPSSVGVAIMDDGSYVTQNSDGSIVQLR